MGKENPFVREEAATRWEAAGSAMGLNLTHGHWRDRGLIGAWRAALMLSSLRPSVRANLKVDTDTQARDLSTCS